ncbi:16S rRNA (guanine(527)-N(7))-methyltransferase RsmG [Pelagibacteraceae bacterium]|jgi:16S rRNA (guanine527-N7)-methyltransferase|nr:16S rRNA (guanine(527)-N(7))-methyltransferase RsmG [Pelagibacteraceae bacterium]|tara:strand:+ start:804 stop:1427 length:624 start_codon:yes stop_codon:yes gene_type:complete
MDESFAKLTLKEKLNFSDEDLEKLSIFTNFLINKNISHNFIAKTTEGQMWSRHILDSAQLVKFIDFTDVGSLADLGSGAGFPGIVLAIFNKNQNFHVKLYEKSPLKSKFLSSIKEKLDLKVIIHGGNYQEHIIDSKYIVARAFKKLPEIIKISREKAEKTHKLIVLKGKNAQEEAEIALKGQNIKYKLEASMTEKDSKILIIDFVKK